jgi:hypothetical protein
MSLTFPDGYKTKLTCRQLEGSVGACEDASGKVIAGVTSKPDCEGVSGVWNNGEQCYNVGTDGIITDKNGFTADICKSKPLAYRYFVAGVCLVNAKVVETADTKAKCEGQGRWAQIYEPAQITTPCTTV